MQRGGKVVEREELKFRGRGGRIKRISKYEVQMWEMESLGKEEVKEKRKERWKKVKELLRERRRRRQ